MASLIPSVIAFAAGIIWSLSAGFQPSPLAWLLCGTMAMAVLASLAMRRPRAAFFVIMPFFFLVGAMHVSPFSRPPTSDSRHIYNHISGRSQATVMGILAKSPSGPPDRTHMILDSRRLSFPDGTSQPTHGLVRLSLPVATPNIEPGDHILARATLNRPKNFATPGSFDYRRFLAAQSIWTVGRTRAPDLVNKLQTLPPPSFAHRLFYLPERLRHRIGLFLDRNLSRKESGLYRALLIGDRTSIPPAQLENFITTGSAHLLAISGMHMGLIALLTIFLFKWLLKRSTWLLLHLPAWKTASILAVPLLAGYAFIAGFQPPALRALVMTFVFIAAILVDRQWSIPTNIAIAALLLLAWRPLLITAASFQLSFAAVISIAVLYPQARLLFLPTSPHPEPKMTETFQRWLVAGLAISTAATLGTLPLQLLHFNRFSPLSPISTLLIEPFLCFWALPVGLLACMMIPLSPSFATLLFKLGGMGLIAADQLTATLARLPLTSFRLPTPTWPEITLYFLALIGLSRIGRSRFAVPTAAVASLALVGSVLWLPPVRPPVGKGCRVTVLDVGQGSSTLVELPRGHTLLIDGGSYQGDQFDIGERVIAPLLWHHRISHLDAVVVSHPHADHYNGLPFILRTFRPAVLWMNGAPGKRSDYAALLQEATRLGIPVRVPSTDAALYAAEGIRISRIDGGASPPHKSRQPRQWQEAPGSDINRVSLVLRLDCGRHSFLFPGDIDKEKEEEMIAINEKLNVDVLLAPHHGSGGSMSRRFMAATSPNYLVISAGAARPSSMAAPHATRQWRHAGIKVFDTGHDGAVCFSSDGTSLTVSTMLSHETSHFRLGN